MPKLNVKRSGAMIFAFVLIFVGSLGRIAYLTLGDTYTVSDGYNSKTYTVSTLYTNIYARDGERLNNNYKSLVAVIKPNEKCLSELELLFDSTESREIAETLSAGEPVIKSINKYANTEYIEITEVTRENDEDMLCRHLLDKSCSGLETVTDEEIGSLSADFAVDASGRILSGDTAEIINDNYSNADGVIISIDSQIQQIAESCAESLEKGSVVIMDCDTSQILASVSVGDDYINRALSAYTVGSVFKLVVCTAAIENGIDPSYKCTGEITVGDTVYHCQNNKKHGKQNIKEALANSCNCYFVNLALTLGADKLYDIAEKFGYCKDITLYTYHDKDFTVKQGSFPLKSELSSLGQLALLGFGQGSLTDTPVHFASIVACIANGGVYHSPTLSLVDSDGTRIMSKSTAETLRSYMKYVVDSGTGANAYYNGETAGKTATAQSGIYSDGEEVLNTWFAGFYPYSNPKYAVVVMCEGGKSGSSDCCPVFSNIIKEIAENSD